MVVSNLILKEEYVEYSNKNTKISREVKNGKLIKLINGLYETNPNVNGFLLAGSIYGPSYLSFDFALFYYGLIPEKVNSFTSATFDKKKKKFYNNKFGNYYYQDVPKSVYPLGINVIEEGEYCFQIASPEKAICDKLYTLKPIKNLKELEMILLNDLRIDFDELKKLSIDDLKTLAKFYHSTNVELLYKYMRRRINE